MLQYIGYIIYTAIYRGGSNGVGYTAHNKSNIKISWNAEFSNKHYAIGGIKQNLWLQ